MKHRVVITGMGVVSPNALGVEMFTEALRAGKSGLSYSKEAEEAKLKSCVYGIPQLNDEYLEEHLPVYHRQKLNNRAIIFACLAGVEAWKNAGNAINGKERLNDVGIVFGAGAVGQDAKFSGAIYDLINQGLARKLGSLGVVQGMNSGGAAFLSQLTGAGHSVISNSSACMTGSESILLGYQQVASGAVRQMICGSSEGYGKYMWGGFDAMRVLCSDSNDNPSFASRPMSNSSAGFVSASGSGALVLETLESAQERGATVFAEILGGAQNCGGLREGGSMTAQNPVAVVDCIQTAMKNADITAEEIDLISGHLTSTKADPEEVTNWSNGLGRKGEDFPYINTPKSMIGHSIGAAGSIETVACVLQLQHGFIHPNLNLKEDTIHPKITKLVPFDKIPTQALNKDIKTIIKSNFGFGDLNCVLVLRKFNG